MKSSANPSSAQKSSLSSKKKRKPIPHSPKSFESITDDLDDTSFLVDSLIEKRYKSKLINKLISQEELESIKINLLSIAATAPD